MTTPGQDIPYRRIGAILVEWNLITEVQLGEALAEQERTGSLLGEILVSMYGVSRVDLADALAEQWHEAHRAATVTAANGSSTPGAHEDGADGLAEGDLRVLLDEAEAARAELTERTDELSKRLESLEQLVVGVTQALDELRSATEHENATGGTSSRPNGSRRSRSRSGRRTQGPSTTAA